MTQATDPVCYRHPSRVTYLRCSRCDRSICPSCTNDAAVGQHCPECAGANRSGQRMPRTAFGGTLAGQQGHVVMALIALNVAVAVLSFLTGGMQAAGGGGWGGLLGGTTPLHVWGSLVADGPVAYGTPDGQLIGVAGGIANGEFYRLFTSMFLHYGLFHLLLNMWALWVVGGVLEPLLGRLRFLALYLLSGLGGGVAVYLTAGTGLELFGREIFGGLTTLTAGASGAVFGLFAAFYIVLRRLRRDTSMITVILVLNLIFTFTVSNISVAGHLGGMLAGAVIALGLAYAPARHRNLVQGLTIGAVALALVVATLARTLALS